MRLSRLAGFAGIGAAVLLNGTFVVLGARREGYSWARDFISELSLGADGWIQKAAFCLGGLLLMVFGAGLKDALKPRGAARTGAGLVMGMGAFLFVAGVFDSDRFPKQGLSWAGAVHDGAAALCFSFMIAALFFLARGFRHDPEWGSLATPALLSGAASLMFFVLLLLAFPLPFKPAPPLLADHIGVWQRASQASFFVTAIAIAMRLLRTPPCIRKSAHEHEVPSS